MRLLILGGTRFVGRHVVDAALEGGHQVTLFNRGLTNPGLYPEVEKLRGGRGEDLSALSGRSFDAVLDIAGYLPRHVKLSTSKLRPRAKRYVFVSSISVYSDFSRRGIDESSPLEILQDENSEDIGRDYGALKVRCEEIVQETYGEASLIVRPGLIVGPHDHTNRFTYWVTRMARGGRVLAPAPPERPIQYIDARDLASWMVTMTEEGKGGLFNAVCPPLTFDQFLSTCADAGRLDAQIEWVDEALLQREGVVSWEEVPLWEPGEDAAGLMSVDASEAAAHGLSFRPLEETVTDTLRWAAAMDEPLGSAGLSPEREAQLLRAWDTEGTSWNYESDLSDRKRF
jgi:2'-hydroxyisoflavone reductase